jgi:MATE family multidrug resistance protein
MSPSQSLPARLIALALPVALARLGIMTMGICDVIVVGQLAPDELAHQALAWAPTGVMIVTGVGLLSGVQVLAAQAVGAGEYARAGSALRRGLMLGVLAGALSTLGLWSAGAELFTTLGIAPELAQRSARVMNVLALSVPLHLAYIAATFFFEAIQRPAIATALMWIANVCNLLLNLWLVPRHGALGSAYATLGARAFLAAGLIAYALFMSDAPRYGTRSGKARVRYGALLRVGGAAALSQAAEAGAFSGMTVLAGRLGERAVATYQILLNLLAVVFMVSLGVASATSVLTAEAVGRADARAATRAGYLGLKLDALTMLVLALSVAALRAPIGELYTADRALASACAALFPLLATVLIPDGAQAVLAGALRARGDNWFPTASHLFAYALVMPALGFAWCDRARLGVSGLLWASLSASVLSAGVLLARHAWLARGQPADEQKSYSTRAS